MNYTKYNPTTGEITSLLTITDINSREVNLANHYIDGHYTADQYYIDVDTQQAVAKPTKPSLMHYWDHDSKQWIMDTTQAAIDVRNERGWRLNAIDRVNPIWYSSLTTEQQTELIVYRQALLDVPEQSGFPTEVVWPIKPAWL